jgi:hypothetical protein
LSGSATSSRLQQQSGASARTTACTASAASGCISANTGPLEQELDRINAVTLADLRATYDAFPIKPTTVGRLMPAEN